MSEQELIKKLKNLREVHPSSTWVDFCRSWLGQQMEIREKILTLSQQPKFQQPAFDIRIFTLNFLKSAVPTAVVLVFLVAGPVGLVFAAKNSLPGHFLFPVKIVYEKTRLVLIPEKEKSKLQIEITNNRLQELRTIVSQNSQSNSANVSQALTGLNQELAVVKKQLPKMAKEQKLGEVAQIVQTAAKITNEIPSSLSVISSTCASFASSSCAFFNQEENQELPAIQTMKMAQEIIKNIEELLEKESSVPDENQDKDLR